MPRMNPSPATTCDGITDATTKVLAPDLYAHLLRWVYRSGPDGSQPVVGSW